MIEKELFRRKMNFSLILPSTWNKQNSNRYDEQANCKQYELTVKSLWNNKTYSVLYIEIIKEEFPNEGS